MRFDHCISNPPYQESGKSAAPGGNNTANNIFHHFYAAGLYIADTTSMIFPGGRWMQRQSKSGAITDVILPTVSQIWWYPNGEERNIHRIFEDVFITDGVSVVIAEKTVTPNIMVGGVEIPRPDQDGIIPLGNDVLPMIEHLTSEGVLSNVGTSHGKSVNKRKMSVGFFDLPSRFVLENPQCVKQVQDDTEWNTPPLGYVRAYLADDSAGAGKRVKKYLLQKDAIAWTSDRRKVFNQWKVVVAQAAAGKRPELGVYTVLEAECVVGSSWVMVGCFDTEVEACNYAAYLNLPFVKKLLAASKGGNTKTWGYFVPDLVDYSCNNMLFNGEDAELQLRVVTHFGLTTFL